MTCISGNVPPHLKLFQMPIGGGTRSQELGGECGVHGFQYNLMELKEAADSLTLHDRGRISKCSRYQIKSCNSRSDGSVVWCDNTGGGIIKEPNPACQIQTLSYELTFCAGTCNGKNPCHSICAIKGSKGGSIKKKDQKADHNWLMPAIFIMGGYPWNYNGITNPFIWITNHSTNSTSIQDGLVQVS